MRFVPHAGLESGRPFVGRPLNTPLRFLIEEGMVGLSLHVALGMLVSGGAGRAIRRMEGARACQTLVLLVGLWAFWLKEMTFSSLAENSLITALYWLLLGSLVSSARAPAARTAG